MTMLLLLLACRPALPGACPSERVEEPEPPPELTAPRGSGANVLIIVVDDLGVDKVGVYGEHPDPPPTPNIDALAARGVRFTNAYAHPTCSPSRASLLTGQHPARHGIGRWIDPGDEEYELPLAARTIPEMLAEGERYHYETAAVGKWHVSSFNTDQPASAPLLQGFDYHAGSLANPLNALVDDGEERSYFHWEKATNGEVAYSDTYMTVDTTDEALGRLAVMQEPWLLWVAYNAPHEPYHAPPEALLSAPLASADDVTLYSAMVEALDAEIGRLLAGLPEGALEDTLVLLLSDNGTSPDVITEPWDASRGKGTVYEGGVRVPFIAAGAHVSGEGRVSEALVMGPDLFATVADIAGVPLADDDALDGRSLLPVLEGAEAVEGRRFLFSQRFYPNGPPPFGEHERTLRDGQWKFNRVDVEGYGVTEELFRLGEGVDEGEDLLGYSAVDEEVLETCEVMSAALDALEAALRFRF
jgi:arylsulfatase B